jgi:hypothetical protein
LTNDVTAALHVASLQEHLDIAQFAEIKVALLVQGVILQLQFLNLSFQLRISRACTRNWLGNTATHAARSTAGSGLTTGSTSHRSSWLGTISGGRRDLSTTKDVEELLAFAATYGIVGLTIVVLFEVGFEPLAELKVVLVLSLGELSNFDVSLDTVLVEGVLENLVIFDEFVLMLGIPFYLGELKGSRVETIHDSAVN